MSAAGSASDRPPDDVKNPLFSTLFRIEKSIFETATGSRWGGVAGVGFEYGVIPNWSFGIEYDHLFVGRTQDVALNFTSGFGGGFSRTDRINSRDVDLVLARVSHHWKY